MSKSITKSQIENIAAWAGIEYAALRAIMMVEGSGSGYDPATGKIKIQFEPHWYRRLDAEDGESGGGVWEDNKVETQPGEWQAFNDAFKKDPDAAMMATSWGIMQVLGLHFRLLGFLSVDAFVDFAKVSEENQLKLGVMFIRKNTRLYDAVRVKDWETFAYYYNGKDHKRHDYSGRLQRAYEAAKV